MCGIEQWIQRCGINGQGQSASAVAPITASNVSEGTKAPLGRGLSNRPKGIVFSVWLRVTSVARPLYYVIAAGIWASFRPANFFPSRRRDETVAKVNAHVARLDRSIIAADRQDLFSV